MEKNVKKVSIIEDMLATLQTQAMGNKYRNDVFNDVVDEITIDTCIAHDTYEWETGIDRNGWIIVEQYGDKQTAKIGHEKWVSKIKENPSIDLVDIGVWEGL